jgi:hypothetical protein
MRTKSGRKGKFAMKSFTVKIKVAENGEVNVESYMTREKTINFLRFVAQNMDNIGRKEIDTMAKKAVKAVKKTVKKSVKK